MAGTRPRIRLAGGRVDLWLVGPVALAGGVAGVEPWLSVEERERVDALVRPAARLQRLVAYAARRAVLSFYARRDPVAWRFMTGPHGRPEIVRAPGTPSLRVNLSHSEGLVAVAVTRGSDVGVDVEAVNAKRRVMEIADRCFAPEEIARLRAAPVEARPALFATFWTLKESYLKARGVGIWGGIELEVCRFELGDDGMVTAFRPPSNVEARPEDWSFFALRPTGEHRGAVAVRRDGAVSPRLEVFRLPADVAFSPGRGA